MLLLFMDTKAALEPIVPLAESHSAVTNIKEVVYDVDNLSFVLHTKYLEHVGHAPTQGLDRHSDSLALLSLDFKVQLGQLVTRFELAVLPIRLQNLVKVSFVQIGESGTSLPPESPFQDVCPEVLGAMWNIWNNMDILFWPNWIWKLKYKYILLISKFFRDMSHL